MGFLILTAYLWAQPHAANTKNRKAIQRAKALRVSAVDRSLPKVSLEFFLQSEGAGAPIEWHVNGCGEHAESHTADAKYDPPICVEADVNLADRAEVTVVFTVGTFKKGPVGTPTLFSIHITDPSGLVRQLERLSDLPMELHRPQPKQPTDFGSPAGLSAGRKLGKTMLKATAAWEIDGTKGKLITRPVEDMACPLDGIATVDGGP